MITNMKTFIRLLSIALLLSSSFQINASAQASQNSIVKAMGECVYTPLPYSLLPFARPYSFANCSISSADISFVIYEDVQCSHPVPGDVGIEMPDLIAKFEFGDKTLCTFDIYGVEFFGNCLAIVDNTGKVYDKLFVGLYCGVFISRQFRIDENGIITVYYFVPDSTNTIYLETLGRFLPTLHGKICTETYNVVNNKFVLQSQEYGPDISCNLKQDKENDIVRNLWDL